MKKFTGMVTRVAAGFEIPVRERAKEACHVFEGSWRCTEVTGT